MIIHKNLIDNETGIDISWTVAYHQKFHDQNKKNNHISSAGMFVFIDVNHGYSLFLESSKDFYRCFWWPQ